MKRTWLLTCGFALVFMGSFSYCFAGEVIFKTHLVVDTANTPRGASLVDVDGDGDLDLLSAATENGQVTWYENNGATSPNFTQHVIATGLGVSSFVLGADMNGDGRMDVVYSSVANDTVAYFENGGTGPLDFTQRIITAEPNVNSIGFAWNVRMISVGDLDGDGDLDVVSAGTDNDRIAWFENEGATWTPHALTDSLDGARAVWVADLDLDGDLDVIGGGWFDDRLLWFENDGNPEPVFTEHVMATFEVNPNPTAVSSFFGGLDGREDSMMWRIMTEDMDGDGDIDVIAARIGGGIGLDAGCCGSVLEWYQSDGGSPPQFTRYAIGDIHHVSGKSVYPADIDQDGDMDIFFASKSWDKVAWWENDGAPTPTFEEHILHIDPDERWEGEEGFADGARSVFGGDIDGDGDVDFVWVAMFSGRVAWEENLTIQLHADFNRDGDVDDSDRAQWESSYGVDAMGDTDGDLDTDGDDFLTWQRQFTGSLGAAAASTAVPEPAAWMLFLGCFALMCTKRGSRGD